MKFSRVDEIEIFFRNNIIDRDAALRKAEIRGIFNEDRLAFIAFEVSTVLIAEVRGCLAVANHLGTSHAADRTVIGCENDLHVFLPR